MSAASDPHMKAQRGADSEAGGHRTVLAIGLMCLAVALFSCLDATAKYLATQSGLPIAQVVWLRFMSQFVLMIAFFGPLALPRLLRSNKFYHQCGRSLLMLASTLCNFIALQYLRLDQTSTIFFLVPLTVALLAGPFLGEWVGWRRMIAIGVGFSGILVAVRPGFEAFHFAFIFSLMAVLGYAGFALVTRYLARFDDPVTTLFYSLIAGAIVMAPIAISVWEWPEDPFVWVLLVMLGFWGGVGHYIFIQAHRFAPASTLAPFIYMSLLTHTALGFAVFGDLPDMWTLAGAAIVIGSGLYLLHRERLAQRTARQA
ncbi:MAG: DMT family transporter [Pseudomonadota bacterium]